MTAMSPKYYEVRKAFGSNCVSWDSWGPGAVGRTEAKREPPWQWGGPKEAGRVGGAGLEEAWLTWSFLPFITSSTKTPISLVANSGKRVEGRPPAWGEGQHWENFGIHKQLISHSPTHLVCNDWSLESRKVLRSHSFSSWCTAGPVMELASCFIFKALWAVHFPCIFDLRS